MCSSRLYTLLTSAAIQPFHATFGRFLLEIFYNFYLLYTLHMFSLAIHVDAGTFSSSVSYETNSPTLTSKFSIDAS